MRKKHEKLISKLKTDCQNCSGLCCVALCYRKSDGFPSNKLAGVTCRHLTENFHCDIHQKLGELNMKGCLNYDCFGAGQKVSRSIYQNIDWMKNPDMAEEIFEVFLKVTQLHQILWYLIQATTICEDGKLAAEIEKLISENEKMTSMTTWEILEIDIDQYRKKANEALKKSCKLDKDIVDKDFIGRDFRKINLDGRDFTMSLLIGANLQGCSLKGTNFLGADIRGVNIMNTDLSSSFFLTQMQINSARGNSNTRIPDYLTRPEYW